MPFSEIIDRYDSFDFSGFASSVTPERVRPILDKPRLSDLDYLALLTDNALPCLEEMAQKAHALTKKHFGNAVFLFTPLYISNYCDNVCAYCSFGRNHAIGRRHLSHEEIGREAELIAAMGIRHLLLLTGESRSKAPPEYIEQAVAILHRHFSSITIEIYALTQEEYAGMTAAGVDGLTIYQETYDKPRYHDLHRGGPKDDYAFRLDAPERACRAGIRTVTVGALLGLADPLRDTFISGLHAAYLQRSFPSVEVALSFPRMRPLVKEFSPAAVVDDRKLAQFIIASRLFLPTSGITLSTRESAEFRDAALPLGVTRLSAGVSTAVGGHGDDSSTPQFEIADGRSVDEVKNALATLGFQAVLHDWNVRYVR